jgi:hypothetical protein
MSSQTSLYKYYYDEIVEDGVEDDGSMCYMEGDKKYNKILVGMSEDKKSYTRE